MNDKQILEVFSGVKRLWAFKIFCNIRKEAGALPIWQVTLYRNHCHTVSSWEHNSLQEAVEDAVNRAAEIEELEQAARNRSRKKNSEK